MMPTVLVTPGEGVVLTETEVPEPGADEVLVRSVLVGICGSDTHAVAGHHPFLISAYVPGHEAVGVVASVGKNVGDLRVGDRVLLKPNVACGECRNCREGRDNACEHLEWIGCDPSRARSGAMATYFVAPRQNLLSVPDGVSDVAAALVECLATPVHAARLAADELWGARVAVFGAGTIGLLCVVAALRAGAGRIVVTDLDPGKCARAVRVGAAAGVLGSTSTVADEVRAALEGPADVVFDAVAVRASLEDAVAAVRRAGTILVVGVPPTPAVVNLPLVQDWELCVQGCAAYTAKDIEASLRIVADGELPVGEIVSEIYGLQDVAQAFAAAAENGSGKVLVRP